MATIPTVSEFMTSHVVTLRADMEIYDGILKLMKHDRSGAPVVKADGTLEGVLSERDCLRLFASAAYNSLPSGKVADYMVIDPETVSPEDDLFSVAQILMNRHFRRLPVVEANRLVGLVTRCDVLRASVEYWKHPGGRQWTDSKYLTPELKAMLRM